MLRQSEPLRGVRGHGRLLGDGRVALENGSQVVRLHPRLAFRIQREPARGVAEGAGRLWPLGRGAAAPKGEAEVGGVKGRGMPRGVRRRRCASRDARPAATGAEMLPERERTLRDVVDVVEGLRL